MIDFVTINGEAYTLITDEDYAEAKAAMRAAGIDQLTIDRACTDDLGDFDAIAGDPTACLDCDVIETSNVLWA